MLVVDEDAVKAVLGDPEYKDHYVAIYTIASPTRRRKSFLFSPLWQFLLERLLDKLMATNNSEEMRKKNRKCLVGEIQQNLVQKKLTF